MVIVTLHDNDFVSKVADIILEIKNIKSLFQIDRKNKLYSDDYGMIRDVITAKRVGTVVSLAFIFFEQTSCQMIWLVVNLFLYLIQVEKEKSLWIQNFRLPFIF